MNHFPVDEGWPEIARLQKARAAATNNASIDAIDLMIDRRIDYIAAGHVAADDVAEDQRTVATAMRRDRHRARLVRIYLVVRSDQEVTPEVVYMSREALGILFAQISPQDAALLLLVGQGESPRVPGLSNAAARKRLSRLRMRFTDLSLQAA